jgi:uncharacterized protein YifE (UPF0438 family)
MQVMEQGPNSDYTERQLDLLRGKVQPETDEEYSYVQDHANDVLPETEKESEPDALRQRAKMAGDVFEERGRPMGGAKDD